MRKIKYGNIKTKLDGYTFDSRKEANRYAELKMLELAGRISQLVIQPKFRIIDSVRWNGKTHRARFYIADFQYFDGEKIIVEDVKSEITKKNPVYTLKRQLFLIQNPEYTFMEI